MRALLVGVVGALVLAAPAAGVEPRFRYERTLEVHGTGPFRFEPDAALAGHTRGGFADLRIVDARGDQVPWRISPPRSSAGRRTEPVRLLDLGRSSGTVVALIDLGPARVVHSQLELVVPGHDFVGHVTVRGGDDRTHLRRLSRVAVWDIRGVRRSRSTTVTFPPSDFRYLELRADGIPAPRGATVSSPASAPPLDTWPIAGKLRRERGPRTVVRLDLGLSLPLDAVEVGAATGFYDRPLSIAASDDGRTFVTVSESRLFRYPGARSGPIALVGRARYLRITIANGDDRPLGPLRLHVVHERTEVLVRGGAATPYTARYGAALRAPSYDFARLPAPALGLDRATRGTLAAERRLRQPVRPRSYRWLAGLGLALAAFVVVGAGVVVLRKTTPA